jgi:hypothetical protein
MARTPVSSGAERGVVRPPNQPGAAGSAAKNSYLPLDRRDGGVHASNYGTGGDRRGGSADLTGQSSPVVPPNHRFDVGMAKMPQPPSAIDPGKGAVPVTPWAPTGQPNRAIPEPDTPRQPPK